MKQFSFRLVTAEELKKHREGRHDPIWDTEKRDFIATATHQLRTPLVGIKWTLNMLVREEVGKLTDEQETWIKAAFRSNERVISMVDSVLNALRVQEGAIKFTQAEIVITEMFQSIVEELLAAAHKKHVTVQLNADENIPVINGDKQKIRVALQNVVDNAVKYTNEGGSVTITVTKEESNVKIAVVDTGIGIPQTEHKDVFKRFFRASNAMRSVKEGSGLGLFITKNVIEKHSGQIWFNSEENKGSTFYIVLPFSGLMA